jgi:hypothetical protein
MAIHQQTDSLPKAGETPDSNPAIAGQQSGPMSGLFYILSLWRFFFHGPNFHRLCFYTLQYSWSKLSSNSIIRNLFCMSVLYGLSCESISYAVRSNFFSGSSFTVLHVQAACPCYMSILHWPAACQCCMFMLHAIAACSCYVSLCIFFLHVMLHSILHVHAVSACCMSTRCISKLHVQASSMSLLHAACRTTCTYYLSMLHVRATCTYCMSMMHVCAICT